ncbi:MAG: error-prone DNA polymerase [Acidobacteria bacterium]|nr:error-prone DNA polymerase [Acidobacteriota bacterium]
MYIELHSASAFSFLDGASLPEALVDRAAALGYPALALVDRDGFYGAPRFHLAAKKAGLRAIVGAEITIREKKGSGAFFAVDASKKAPDPFFSLWRLPVLVESAIGYKNLCRLITQMKLRAPKGEGSLDLEELDGRTAGLVALIGREALQGPRHGVGGLVDRAVGMFGRGSVYVELQRHLRRDEESDNHALLSLASAFHVPVIATNGVRFAEPADRPLYDVLTCLRHKTTIARAGRRLSVNAERYLKSPEQMAVLFHDLPHAVAATRDLADRLQYTMADLGYRFPEYPVPAGETMGSFLRKITDAGARERYRPYHARARAQIERELSLVEKLDLAGYFLIVWDIVNYCRQHGILVQGRGSAANSAVCYSLGITAVDPVGMDLLFERFLSEERGEWPDIDLDLPSGDRREQVIQYVYERYGKRGAPPEGQSAAPEGQSAAMTANVITYRGRSAARDIGKVLGLEPGEVDRLAKVMNPFEWIDPKDTLERHLRDAGLDPANAALRTFGHLWERIHDLPRHLGQHSGGMIVCQGRLDEVVPLENASMPGRVVAQWDKDDCADMGIVKVDLLGLGMMAVLQDALTIVNSEARGAPAAPLDLVHLPPDDPAVYRMLQEADTIGIFQVESRAQMATLPRMKPERFYDIVVEVAIIRPGPIVGQMVHPYLKRRRGVEPVVYPHPSLAPILERTLGVPLFQEQLLRMAMVAAGFTGGEAEELRRAFGFKRSEKRMRVIEQKLRDGIAKQGIGDDAAEEIIRAITSFALYGFPESHAASFALLVYASAYLKAHYPAAFYTAMLNNQPMGFYSPATLVKDAQRRGVRFAPIDVQVSGWGCSIEEDGRVRLGLRYVNGLRAEAGKAIEQAGPPHDRTSHDRTSHDRTSHDRTSHRGTSHVARDICPKCGSDDEAMIERVGTTCFCSVCAHEWAVHVPRATCDVRRATCSRPPSRFTSLDDFVARSGVHRDELRALADIGALNAFGYERRAAMWQIERAMRPAGELFSDPGSQVPDPADASPLARMTLAERIEADYAGTGLTIGPHPMSLRRQELALRGVLRACDLPQGRHGRRVRVAGAVIARQRPGTAKGFVFLTLEDETGIANIIVRPDLFAKQRRSVVGEAYLLVEGTLQIQEGVTSIKAERLYGLGGGGPDVEARDFH